MPCVYVLKSQKTSKHYVGSSHENDSILRLAAHNNGKVKSTKFGKPWEVIYQEVFEDYTSARKRELFLKTGQGRKFLLEAWQSGRMRQS